jgi:hypothetical protein
LETGCVVSSGQTWASSLPRTYARTATCLPRLTWLHTQANELPVVLIKALIQLNRWTGETRLKADLTRWAITPDNAQQKIDILHPQFNKR